MTRALVSNRRWNLVAFSSFLKTVGGLAFAYGRANEHQRYKRLTIAATESGRRVLAVLTCVVPSGPVAEEGTKSQEGTRQALVFVAQQQRANS